MHRLDNHIRDIEPRIQAIYNNAYKQEEPSLQESLASYGWILLDSWVAWRTLRFVLKDADISLETHEKWFQTPSSYTASQLKAIWRFKDSVSVFLKDKTDKTFKELIDSTIQAKRNSSAHFSENKTVKGIDAADIEKIFNSLSVVFLLYEICAFLDNVSIIMEKKMYNNFAIYTDTENTVMLSVDQFRNSVNDFSTCKSFYFCCKKSGNNYLIRFDSNGCTACVKNKGIIKDLGRVLNDKALPYNFFENKGYYQNVELFVNTIVEKWVPYEKL